MQVSLTLVAIIWAVLAACCNGLLSGQHSRTTRMRYPDYQGIVYTLRLEDNKYYVGYTNDVYRRLQEHLSGDGSNWTRLYPPVPYRALLSKKLVYDSQYDFVAENAVTVELMARFGIDNVRGGIYHSPDLSLAQREKLQHLIIEQQRAFAIQYRCVGCGQRGHRLEDCWTPPDKQKKFQAEFANIVATEGFWPDDAENCSWNKHIFRYSTLTKRMVCLRCPQTKPYWSACSSKQQQKRYTTRRGRRSG